MLKHEWMRQREPRIRQAVQEARSEAELASETTSDAAQVGAEMAPPNSASQPEGSVPVLPESGAPEERVVTPPAEPAAESQSTGTQDHPATPTASAALPDGDGSEQKPAGAQTARNNGPGRPERPDPRAVAERIDIPHSSLRERLHTVLARQTQLPLDIEARRAVSDGVENSPRETREALVQRLLDPTLTLEEAALLLGVCRTTVRRYTDRGILRCFRTPGNQRRFNLSDVLDLMERQSRGQ